MIERVLGLEDAPAPNTEIIDLGVRPWLGGTVTSAVQVTMRDDQSESHDRGASASKHSGERGRAGNDSEKWRDR